MTTNATFDQRVYPGVNSLVKLRVKLFSDRIKLFFGRCYQAGSDYTQTIFGPDETIIILGRYQTILRHIPSPNWTLQQLPEVTPEEERGGRVSSLRLRRGGPDA